MAASARRCLGSVIPSDGSSAMILSRWAARNTDRTLLNLVPTVPGASPAVFIFFTHASMWDRRIAFIGMSANVVDPTASFIASTVPRTHT